jgi:hypothetical protein
MGVQEQDVENTMSGHMVKLMDTERKLQNEDVMIGSLQKISGRLNKGQLDEEDM